MNKITIFTLFFIILSFIGGYTFFVVGSANAAWCVKFDEHWLYSYDNIRLSLPDSDCPKTEVVQEPEPKDPEDVHIVEYILVIITQVAINIMALIFILIAVARTTQKIEKISGLPQTPLAIMAICQFIVYSYILYITLPWIHKLLLLGV